MWTKRIEGYAYPVYPLGEPPLAVGDQFYTWVGPRRIAYVGDLITCMKEGRRYLVRVVEARQESYRSWGGSRKLRSNLTVQVEQI